MIRYIFKNWMRQKERFILMLIGVLVVSVGLALLFGLSETNRGTVVNELQKRWSSSYDIVVRPEGSRSITEENNLLDPNYLSGIHGGISMEDYEVIKNIDNVEVAAPIAMIGNSQYNVDLAPMDFEEGIYRLRHEVENREMDDMNRVYTSYFAAGDWNINMENLQEYGPFDRFLDTYFTNTLTTNRSLLLAGIDPEQEAQLVGLEQAVLDLEGSRYFTDDDVPTQSPFNDSVLTNIPVIVSNHTFSVENNTYTIERLDIPFNREIADETIQMLDESGREEYLDTVEGEAVETYTFTEEDIITRVINSLSRINVETGEPFQSVFSSDNRGRMLTSRSSVLQYESVASPFPDTWPYAYQLEKYTLEIPELGETYETFRSPDTDSLLTESGDFPVINTEFIGFYDPANLNLSTDPLNELPMETYRPATAQLVMDSSLNPVNPPKQLSPSGNPLNEITFIQEPPVMLTTLEAAEMIVGDQPISAIRIKVDNVSSIAEDSQEIIEKVADDIERETGLLTDITLGSSPQPTLVNVPSINDEEELGWFEQPWVKIGSSITIFREARIGFSGIVMSVVIVAILYVWASRLVSILARKEEFGVLLAVGWRPNKLSRLLFTESMILGVSAAILSWVALAVSYFYMESAISPVHFLLTGLFAWMIYMVGAITPAMLARKISPYSTIRTGEISVVASRFIQTKGLLSMAFNHFVGKWRRNLLSVIAIALPSSLLALFIYITFRLEGIMYTTWLGQYVAFEVGPIHYIAVSIALMIAVLTAGEIMWQNIKERGQELAILKAIGWKNGSIRMLVWTEGLLAGIIAMILSLVVAFGMIWGLYGELPTEALPYILATGLIPLVVGVLGTMYPAEKAVKISPSHGMRGNDHKNVDSL